MKFFSFILLMLFSFCAPALCDTPNQDFGFLFDRLPGQPLARKYKLGVKIREAHNTAICVYDFATQGGAVATVNLKDAGLLNNCSLPGKAVIRGGFTDVTTAITSPGNGTIALSSGQSAGDLLAATAGTGRTGEQALIPVIQTPSTYIKLTTAVAPTNLVLPTMTIASSALTAGHFRVFIDYELSE